MTEAEPDVESDSPAHADDAQPPQELSKTDDRTTQALLIAAIALTCVFLLILASIRGAELVESTGEGPAADAEFKDLDRSEDNPPYQEWDSQAPDGGDVELVDSGNSDIVLDPDTQRVCWGAVVENTSDTAVARVQLTVTLYGHDGAEVHPDLEEFAMIEVLLPGERGGTGSYAYIDVADVAEAEVEIDSVSWHPVDDPDSALVFADLTVEDVEHAGESARGGELLEYSVESEYADILGASSTAVTYHDADGELLGGAVLSKDDLRAQVPPGQSTQTARTLWHQPPPEDADLSKTEIFEYPTHHNV